MHTVTPGGIVTNRLSTTDELAEIRARANADSEGPWWRHDDLDDVSRLLDAVEAVLAMHEPVSRPLVNGGTFDECSYCVDPQDNTWRLDYPCPTVQAIMRALGASE